MEAPAITRHRRPFLAPLWIPAVAVLLLAVLLIPAYRALDTTTIVLVRHAEKELSSIDDPPLAPEGELRAEKLAQMFGKITGVGRLDAIYVSDTRRTQQTVEPLAARLQLQPVVVPATELDTLARRALHDHRGGSVLVVAHSNTIPALARRIAGIDLAPIADDDFGGIYLLSVPTLGKANVVKLEY